MPVKAKEVYVKSVAMSSTLIRGCIPKSVVIRCSMEHAGQAPPKPNGVRYVRFLVGCYRINSIRLVCVNVPACSR